jgi:hypothetical protein
MTILSTRTPLYLPSFIINNLLDSILKPRFTFNPLLKLSHLFHKLLPLQSPPLFLSREIDFLLVQEVYFFFQVVVLEPKVFQLAKQRNSF